MFENINNTRKIAICIGAIIIVAIIVIMFYNKYLIKNQELDLDENILVKENEIEQENIKETNENKIIIHITGEIKKPGVIKLPEGSRIEDAIQAAGGLTENSDISGINLAYVLEDGIKIKVPSLLEKEEKKEEPIITEENDDNIVEKNNNQINIKKSININKANIEELTSLPGIGVALATKIIEYREQNGKFEIIEDIKNVNGLGENKFENIKNLICTK